MINKILNRLGVKKTEWTPPDTSFNVLYENLIKSSDPVIIDVGSHRGESIERFRRLWPQCTIHSFEPDNENYAVLLDKFGNDPRIFLNNVGIGDQNGKLTFHRYAKSDVSSFVEIDKESTWTKIRSAQNNTTPDDFETGAYEVEVITLDSYINNKQLRHVDLMKMDTQGFEDKALIGMGESLRQKKVDYIELELIVKSPYKSSLLFRDIENILVPADYHMYGIKKGSNYYLTSILQFDLLFARSECYLEGSYADKI